ncbi:class I SAM-dependent methyltransferase [Skermanella pratensis]|uniref:class I SAM-dependent methyltransferase n=1 Tax=Skermanella pratensis TaxID=2233999 RepID=UPI0013013E40|nr:class I SAM-dependent methyltransferase [Skermanella pratensis]
MIGPARRAAYALSQTARISWFFGQYLLAARLDGRAVPKNRVPSGLKTPDRATILADLRALMSRDFANIEAGCYRMPHDMVEPPRKVLRDAVRFFQDLPEVRRRRRGRIATEVFEERRAEGSKLPRYYLQNFHYQTDGYLSDHSAELYDHQVEVLFGGGADAMRRQALVPLHRHFRERRVAESRLLDVACGTGRFLTFVKDNYPRLDVTALDLSPNYLRQAQRLLSPWSRTRFVQAAAEGIPARDESFDAVTCIYLFHELPRKVRAAAAAEMARVLKRDGILVFVETLQKGDRPDYDGLLDLFPLAFYEPYYDDYIRQDIGALFSEAGLEIVDTTLAFMSKVVVLRKR